MRLPSSRSEYIPLTARSPLVEDVKEFASKMEATSRRQSRRSAHEEEEDEESEVDVKPQKRRITARQSIMAFLGDEDGSD